MKKEKRDIIFLILLIVCIFLFAYTIITLIKDKDIIFNDPITYGMQVHNFSYCECIDSNGITWKSIDNGFIKGG